MKKLVLAMIAVFSMSLVAVANEPATTENHGTTTNTNTADHGTTDHGKAKPAKKMKKAKKAKH